MAEHFVDDHANLGCRLGPGRAAVADAGPPVAGVAQILAPLGLAQRHRPRIHQLQRRPPTVSPTRPTPAVVVLEVEDGSPKGIRQDYSLTRIAQPAGVLAGHVWLRSVAGRKSLCVAGHHDELAGTKLDGLGAERDQQAGVLDSLRLRFREKEIGGGVVVRGTDPLQRVGVGAFGGHGRAAPGSVRREMKPVDLDIQGGQIGRRKTPGEEIGDSPLVVQDQHPAGAAGPPAEALTPIVVIDVVGSVQHLSGR